MPAALLEAAIEPTASSREPLCWPQGLVQLGRHLLASASGDALAPLEAALAQLSSPAPVADDKVRA